jgi:hypothetical protein
MIDVPGWLIAALVFLAGIATGWAIAEHPRSTPPKDEGDESNGL